MSLAFFLKFFGNVYVYRSKGKCRRFLDDGVFPQIADFHSVEEWRDSLEKTYLIIKKNADKLQSQKLDIFYASITVEQNVVFYQNITNEFEQFILFETLVNHYDSKKIIVEYPFLKYLRNSHPELLSQDLPQVLTNNFLDYINLLFSHTLVFLKAIYRCVVKPEASTAKNKNYKYISTGISPTEHPIKEGELNFSWLVENKIISSEDILYILSAPADENSQDFLKKRNINYISKRNLLTVLPLKERINIFFDILLNYLGSIFFLSYKEAFVFTSMVEGRCWHSLVKHFNPKFYLFSISAGWPEPNEVPLLNQMGVTTINWLYSSAEFGYRKDADFSDLNIRFSFQASKEIWVWNSLTKQLFEKRSINSYGNKIKVIGPMLNGDWGPLKNKTRGNHPFTITIFDMSPMKTRMRLEYGAGPFCPPEMVESFYKGIRRLFEVYPEINIEIKTKRNNDPKTYYTIESLEYLRELKSDRIKIFPTNTTPYLALQKSDMVISVPYSSPSLLALAIGIPSCYFESTSITTNTFNKAFDNGITIHTEEDLIKRVDLVMKKEIQMERYYSTNHIDRISFEEMEQNLKNNL